MRRPVLRSQAWTRRLPVVLLVGMLLFTVVVWTRQPIVGAAATPQDESRVVVPVANAEDLVDASGSGADDDKDDEGPTPAMRQNARLKPLPLQPRYYLMCRDAIGPMWIARKGLMAAGFLETRNVSDASVFVACNKGKMPHLMKLVYPKILITNILGVTKINCIGSGKARQYNCRRLLAKADGCDFNDLGVSPAQYLLPDDCDKLVGKVHVPVLTKPVNGLQGRGIVFHAQPPPLKRCLEDFPDHLAQVYAKSALVDGKKFDVRTWLLVAQVDPLMVFTADGFSRVAGRAFSINATSNMVHITNAAGQGQTKEHYRTFASISESLRRFNPAVFDEQYMNTSFRAQVDRASLYVALAQFKTHYGDTKWRPRVGCYQLFGCDWVIDTVGGVHLLECNGYADQYGFDAKDGTPTWEQMMALILNLHWEPQRLFDPAANADAVKRKGVWRNGVKVVGNALIPGEFRFGKWRLILNENVKGLKEYNACKL